MIGQDRAFPAAYDAEVVDDLPAAGVDFEISAPGGSSRATAVFVQLNDGASWSASVAGRADALRSSISGLFATPDPNVLCVVERGTAFLVDVRDPAEYRVVPAEGSVTAVIPVCSSDLLLLATPWAIVAVDDQGVSWTTGRISIEDLRVDEIGQGWLRGVADPDDDEPRNFAVELAGGRVVGGAGL